MSLPSTHREVRGFLDSQKSEFLREVIPVPPRRAHRALSRTRSAHHASRPRRVTRCGSVAGVLLDSAAVAVDWIGVGQPGDEWGQAVNKSRCVCSAPQIMRKEEQAFEDFYHEYYQISVTPRPAREYSPPHIMPKLRLGFWI